MIQLAAAEATVKTSEEQGVEIEHNNTKIRKLRLVTFVYPVSLFVTLFINSFREVESRRDELVTDSDHLSISNHG
jgi:hypothetical protein